MSSLNQIKYGAIISYIAIALNIISGLIVTPWMVKSIGVSDYALYTVVNSLIALLTIDFGLSAATSKFVSQYRAEGREDKISSFLGIVYKLYITVDLIIFLIILILFFFIDKIYLSFTAQEIEKLKCIYIMAGSFLLFSFPFVNLNGILNSYEKFIQLKLSNIIHRVLVVVFIAVALIMGYGLYGVVAANITAGISVIVYKLTVIKKEINISINFHSRDNSILKLLLKFSFWTTVSAMASRLIFSIMPTIMAIYTDTKAIAVFGVVTTLEGYSYTFAGAINGMFMPKISKIYADHGKNSERILELMIKVGNFQFALNSLIITGFLLVGKDFILLWMGKEYIGAYIGTLLVMFPSILYNPLQIANTSMIVENKVYLPAMVALITGLCNVIFSLIIVPIYGFIGACISISVAYMVRVIILWILHKKVMKINILVFMKKCYLKNLIPVIFTIIIGGLFVNWYSSISWLDLAIKGIVICGIYAVFFGAFCIKKEQILSVDSKIKRR